MIHRFHAARSLTKMARNEGNAWWTCLRVFVCVILLNRTFKFRVGTDNIECLNIKWERR